MNSYLINRKLLFESAIGIALISLNAGTVLAEEFDYYAHINKYVKCEAIQNVVANIVSESEQEFYQHELHHASLDSRIVALEFAKAGNYKEAMVAELYNTYLDEYRSQLKGSQDVEKFVAALRPHVSTCQRLNDMQSDIIERKKQQRIKSGAYLKK